MSFLTHIWLSFLFLLSSWGKVITPWAPGESYRCFAYFAYCLHLCSISAFLGNASLIMQTARFQICFTSILCMVFQIHTVFISETAPVSTFSMTTWPMNVNFHSSPNSTAPKCIFCSFTPLSHSLIVSVSVFILVYAAIYFSLHPIQSWCIKPIFWQACRDYGDNETATAEVNAETRYSRWLSNQFLQEMWILSLVQYAVCSESAHVVCKFVQSLKTVYITKKHFKSYYSESNDSVGEIRILSCKYCFVQRSSWHW